MTMTIKHNKRLKDMLSYKRGHGSATEAQWIERFIQPYEPINLNDMALVIVTDDKSRTMFSCHTDSVHRKEGRQKVKYNTKEQTYYKDDDEPLGADDAAGAWLMLEMIDAGVPGTYVFHRGEECGGIGSRFLAAHYDEFLESFDRAIAFDRRGSTSVITHQGMGRCCSDTFAEALADALSAHEPCIYMPDDTGVFTDTANYTEIIPECTNIACGYANEHSGRETLHLPTIFALRDACIKLDWESLPTERNPLVMETKSWSKSSYYAYDLDVSSSTSLYGMTRSEMEDMAYTDPETFVALVRQELFDEPVDKRRSYSNDNDYGYAYDWSIRRK
jgi:hypothetical protein